MSNPFLVSPDVYVVRDKPLQLDLDSQATLEVPKSLSGSTAQSAIKRRLALELGKQTTTLVGPDALLL